MYKKIIALLFFIFSLLSLWADDEDYLENVTLEPSHGYLNYDGSLKILFDLPKRDLTTKAYLQMTRDNLTTLFDSTILTSDFSNVANSMVLTGSELYDVLDSSNGAKRRNSLKTLDNPKENGLIAAIENLDENELFDDGDSSDSDIEIPDGDVLTDDPTDKSWADGSYKIQLKVEFENEEEEETNDDDDDDFIASDVPDFVTQTIAVNFDNTPPKAPSLVEISGGNKRLVLKITPPTSTDDNSKKDKIGKYYANVSGLFLCDGVETQKTLDFSSTVDKDSYNKIWEFTVSGRDGCQFINNDGDNSDYLYAVEVYAEDLAGNSNKENKISAEGSAVTTLGFWSYYAANGGKDDGGFCFVATAGFGSYFHPHVLILRNFRDVVLAKSSFGRVFIKNYYAYGRYPAEIIKDSPFIGAIARTFLLPFVVTAWFLTATFGKIVLALWLSLILFFFLKSKRAGLLFPCLLFLLLCGQNLYGIGGEFSFTNSLYYPNKIDPQSDVKPFKDIFGSQIRYLPSLTFGFAMPALEKYIRWSLIGGIGYTRFSGRAMKADGVKSSDLTRMRIFPLTAEMKIRPVYAFPLYPYLTCGFDYYVWQIRETGKTVEDGGTFGLHGTFGLMVPLNWLDASASKNMETTAGIKCSALFVQYRLEKIDDFGKDRSFDLSNFRFEFGILFEF